jgi:hypothetical protein
MDDQAKALFDAVLHEYDGEVDRRKSGKDRESAEADSLHERFGALRKKVIAPTMREVGEYIKSRGHDYEIESGDKRDVGGGQADEPFITFRVYPEGFLRARMDPEHTPTLTFRAGDTPGRLRTQFVKKLVGRQDRSGVGHTYTLEAVTPDLVRSEILELLEAVIGRSAR